MGRSTARTAHPGVDLPTVATRRLIRVGIGPVYEELIMKLRVEGMTCGHCVRAITTAIHRLDSTAQVDVDRAGGHVRIAGGDIGIEAAAQAIQEEGYVVAALLEDEGNSLAAIGSGSCCGTCHA